MIDFLRQMFRPRQARRAPAVPPGQRIYAIGDVHGRSDLFQAMIAAIDADDAASSAARTTVILLGDLVDRGDDSAGVVAAARNWAQGRKVRHLVGNHEEQFVAALQDDGAMRAFLRMGGRETALSYPVDGALFASADLATARRLMRAAVPKEDLEFLEAGVDGVVSGDYLFVHAGIRPEIPLTDQAVSDLRWIRSEFTNSRVPHPHCVVHGHTITEEVDVHPNRIGIDTGAFFSGRLTALRLEGTERTLLQTAEHGGKVVVEARRIS